jgi:hypothetical protein
MDFENMRICSRFFCEPALSGSSAGGTDVTTTMRPLLGALAFALHPSRAQVLSY